ncbi:MAG: hypothetical protein FWH21_07300 [Kiritimatiellaeota bacterium]|nr:hypothetical protein [Kiritimatiellota bacterium]
MTNRLFTLCNGKLLKRTDGTFITVQSVSDLNLDNITEPLRYYDPGKYPQVFGERPKNVFNMEE